LNLQKIIKNANGSSKINLLRIELNEIEEEKFKIEILSKFTKKCKDYVY